MSKVCLCKNYKPLNPDRVRQMKGRIHMSNFTAVINGRLSKEVRMGFNKSTNNPVCNITVAVEMGTVKKTTRFIDIAFWGALANSASQLRKGQQVTVKADQINATTNQVPKKDGKKGEMTTFTNIQLVGIDFKAGALPQALQNQPQPQVAPPVQTQVQMPMEAFGSAVPGFSEEIPF